MDPDPDPDLNPDPQHWPQVSRGTSGNPLHEAWLTAGQQAGYPLTEDMNGYQQEGVGRMDATIYKVMPRANYERVRFQN